jgi:NTE family protein
VLHSELEPLSQNKIRAYAVLSGGGVKGAALAGALSAAEEFGIEFIGYGGCSAGSIVALLAALGYTSEELKQFVIATDFAHFLDDSGQRLKNLQRLTGRFANLSSLFHFRTAMAAWSGRRLWRLVNTNYGLYNGARLTQFVEERIREKIPALSERGASAITFSHLENEGCRPLKVIASNIQGRKPIVYSSSPEGDDEVSRAIRASVGFPFVFEPVKDHRGHYLLDGGLSSNLPAMLFEEERSWGGVPVIAFDLQSSNEDSTAGYSLRGFCGDLLATALEAGDTLHRMFSNVHYIPIIVPEGIGTLDFFLTQRDRTKLWDQGNLHAYSTLAKIFRNVETAETPIEGYQAALNLPPELVASLLKALVTEVEHATRARHVHAYVFLRTEPRRLTLTYFFDGHGSAAPEISLDVGATWPACKAYKTKKPSAVDLAVWRARSAETRQQVANMPAGRRAFFSVPLFDLAGAALAEEAMKVPAIGALAVDSDTSLEEAEWITAKSDCIFEITSRWAEIVARVLR